ncbi:efflux pump antibiotic resistance protein, putative [Talaromyces stipitatus ATCC 10500]|uniref:Efflux pump antibiotic resistance protein, putative n=1 Tax=Talaromyces stipitatus (strain ATCC 10500 / CBS 375.48 / QM 6759 / NRRL 1006) TaxID=441959 RepID=B8MJ40_TALSN|nr:efflux pump antibiotic resistance protein, putative [Talaromyces stipitatus ATCC 10500]EED15702.1 efflux pump antibiotic resistance protein, putative [Talaromyces stipitatus ATCC 10500]
MSDLVGRKATCMTAVIIFTAFSGGCGATQTMTQLIVCRAFQGIGGSGIYSISMVMIYELVPPPKYPLYTASAIALVALGNAIGPIFGGLITENTTWRWVFLLNIPIGVLSGGLLLFTVPRDFPYQGNNEPRQRPRLENVDFLGALLMLSAVALIVSGFEQAASLLSWRTAKALGPLCASAVAWIAFFASQYWHDNRLQNPIQPVFPWRFCQNRVILGLIISSFMFGAVSITFVFQLPIRYQNAVDLSPLQAGLRLLPFSLTGPVGSIIAASLSKYLRIPPIYLMICGSILQILGIIFASRAPTGKLDWNGLYGLEVVVGLGFGFCLGAATLLTPFVLEKRDLAVGTAATVQFRFFGGAVVVSIVTAVGNSWIKNSLLGSLEPQEIMSIFRSTDFIRTLPENLQATVREDFAESFNLQMRVVLGFAVAGTLTTLLMWQKSQVRVH